MTQRSASSRVRDGLLGLVALIALLGLAVVIAVAPKQATTDRSSTEPRPTSTTSVETEDAADDGSDASTPRSTPAPTATPEPTATPKPTPTPVSRSRNRTATDRAAKETPRPTIAKMVSCAEITPGPTAEKCVTRKRKRTVVLGGIGAPVALSGAVVSVQQVDVVKTRRRDVVRLRLRGGISLPASARGALKRSKYYFGAGERRFRAVKGGTGLRAPVVGKASRFRVSFDIPRTTFERVNRPGVSTRFVWAPPGVDVLGMEPVGVAVLSLSAAIR